MASHVLRVKATVHFTVEAYDGPVFKFVDMSLFIVFTSDDKATIDYGKQKWGADEGLSSLLNLS